MSARDAVRKVRSVRLVPPDDPAYLSAMAEQALAHRRYGAREETTATYRASGRVEEAVRSWLGARVPLMRERILAAEVLYRDGRTYEPLFLELDAVEGRDGVPSRIYEIKFTTSASAIRRGFGQVERAHRLLATRYDRVEGAVVLLHAGHGAFELDDPQLVDVTPITADDLVRGAPLPPRALLRVGVADVAAELEESELTLLQAALDEGDAHAIAREERAARLEAGESLPPPVRTPLPGATLTFGDDEAAADGDSPFAVLRRMREPGSADER